MTEWGLQRSLAALTIVVASAGCQGWRAQGYANETLHAVLWAQTSAEHYAVVTQLYRLARARLAQALDSSDLRWTAALEQTGNYSRLKPAVILDLDETLLDSARFQARLIRAEADFTIDDWQAWVQERRALAVPGALEFVQYATRRGVKVFYVTNRRHEVEDATQRNLEDLGFPVDADGGNLLTKGEQPDWGPNKSSRRAFIARRQRILLIVGDQLNDFFPETTSDPEGRLEQARQYRSYWGERWIVIPNPMYGGWERALSGSRRSLSAEEMLQRKYEQLNP
jgi:5'-nucleotidase (lipoprotein e(P4) family)